MFVSSTVCCAVFGDDGCEITTGKFLVGLHWFNDGVLLGKSVKYVRGPSGDTDGDGMDRNRCVSVTKVSFNS